MAGPWTRKAALAGATLLVASLGAAAPAAAVPGGGNKDCEAGFTTLKYDGMPALGDVYTDGTLTVRSPRSSTRPTAACEVYGFAIDATGASTLYVIVKGGPDSIRHTNGKTDEPRHPAEPGGPALRDQQREVLLQGLTPPAGRGGTGLDQGPFPLDWTACHLRRMRRVIAVTVLAWLLVGVAPAGSAEAAAPAGPAACGEPRGLIDAGHPQEALEWLDDRASEEPRCPGLRTVARAAEQNARAQLIYALALAEQAEDDPAQWSEVEALLPGIAAVDEDVEVSGQTLDTLRATVETGLADSRGFLSEEGVDAASKGWSGLADNYLKDVGAILAAAAATALLLLVLARIAVTIPYRSSRRRRSSRGSRRFAEIVGALSLVAASLFTALTLPTAVGETSVRWGLLAVMAFLCVVAVVALAYVLSTRLRVSISVSGETEKAGTTELVALLQELGAQAPRGLEVPMGTELTALDGKNILGQSTGWLAAVLNVLQQILGFTPWRAVVDHKGDPAQETFVVITRNGRSVNAATIRRQPWGPAGPTIDTSKMAAAFILKALADGYHERDFRGLAGAQDWASLGLQYVATTDRSLSAAHRKELLTRAVDIDPSNLLAQVALKHEQYRHATDHHQLHTYLRWLRDLVGGDPLKPKQVNVLAEHADLDLRVRYTALAVALNHDVAASSARTCDVARDDLCCWALSVLARLYDGVPQDKQPRPQLELPDDWSSRPGELASPKLRRMIQVAAAPMLAQANVWDENHLKKMQTDSPTAEYNTICWKVHKAARDETTWQEMGAERDACVVQLERILATPEEIRWAKQDPTLAPLRALPSWVEAFGAKPRSFLDVAPFKAHADALRTLGMDSPTTLAGSALPPPEGAKSLGISTPMFERLQEAARLIVDIRSSKLSPQRVEIFVALWALGIGNLAALRTAPFTPAVLTDRILGALQALPTPQPDRGALECWVQARREVPRNAIRPSRQGPEVVSSGSGT